MRRGRERRGAERYEIRTTVEFRCAILTGKGSLLDVSLSGARIEEAERRPLVGEQLRIVLPSGSPDKPDWLAGEVVRHTPTGGFAVRFLNVDMRALGILRKLLPGRQKSFPRPQTATRTLSAEGRPPLRPGFDRPASQSGSMCGPRIISAEAIP